MFQLQVGKSLPCSHSRSVGGDFSAWGLAGLQEAWYRFPSSLWSGFWASIVICTFKDNRIFLGKYFVYVYQPWHRRPKVDLPRDYELPYNTKMSCQIDCFPTFLLLSFFIERRWWAEGGWDADIDQATPWTFLSIWKKKYESRKGWNSPSCNRDGLTSQGWEKSMLVKLNRKNHRFSTMAVLMATFAFSFPGKLCKANIK